MSGNLKTGPQTAALLPGTHILVEQLPFRRDASAGTCLLKIQQLQCSISLARFFLPDGRRQLFCHELLYIGSHGKEQKEAAGQCS